MDGMANKCKDAARIVGPYTARSPRHHILLRNETALAYFVVELEDGYSGPVQGTFDYEGLAFVSSEIMTWHL